MGGDLGPNAEQINVLGNHLGSYSLGISWKKEHFRYRFYWQTFLEDKNGRVGVDWKNKGDGLWGLSMERTDESDGFRKVLFEFFNSTSQSGDPSKSGNDNYFNNYLYRSGWTYHEMTIGSPLITSPLFTERTPEMANYLENNSVRAFIGGIQYQRDKNLITLKLTYSNNYGTISIPYTHIRHQFYSMLEYTIDSKRYRNLSYNLTTALDLGSLLGNNFGVMVKVRKAFD